MENKLQDEKRRANAWYGVFNPNASANHTSPMEIDKMIIKLEYLKQHGIHPLYAVYVF